MFQTTDNPEYDDLDKALEEEDAPEEDDTETGEEGDEEEEAPAPAEDKSKEVEKPDARIPEKFKGKSAAEIAEAYTNLEAMVNTKALEIAQGLMGGKKADPETIKKHEVEDDLGLTEEQLKSMSPKQFLAHINKTITERAQRIASETFQRTNEVRTTVRNEVREVTKTHPHLKTNPKYREIVIDMIDAAQARGEKLTLKDACKKADDAMGIKVEPAKPAEPAVKKKPRTGMEKVVGTEDTEVLDDEEKVKQGILSAGPRVGLGGL